MIVNQGEENQQVSNNRIAVVLKEQGRTNKWLAAKTGISETQISGYATNRNQPSLPNAYKIATVLGVQMESLVRREVA